jgi:hypothetical protein
MPGTIQDIIKNQSIYDYKKPIAKSFEILPNLYIGNLIDEQYGCYGTDTISHATKHNRIEHYNNYYHKIHYIFNERGFRDRNWPRDLQDSVWCVGDSHTLGIGVRQEEIYPNVLENISSKSVINVSFYAANNIWISCAAVEILQQIKPKNLVIGWTHFDKIIFPDEPVTNKLENLIFFKKCVDRVLKANQNTNIIHFIIPNATLHTINKSDYKNFLGMIELLDYGRDQYHIGIKTHTWLAEEIERLLC